MAYLEELLPDFRKGAKIRMVSWPASFYYEIKDGKVYNQDGHPVISYSHQAICENVWELYQEPIDWDYIIKNKCLCWFWDEGEEGNKIAGILRRIQKDSPIPFITDAGEYDYTTGYANCRPVRRDEVTFYEDKKDE